MLRPKNPQNQINIHICIKQYFICSYNNLFSYHIMIIKSLPDHSGYIKFFFQIVNYLFNIISATASGKGISEKGSVKATR